MRYLLLIVSAVAISAGCWTEQEIILNVDSDTGTDTDSDSDSDSDSESASDIDTETEEEGCGPPTGITDWGGPCHTTADCPPDTTCRIINSLDSSQGFCAAECCNFSTPDTDYCTDVAGGQEGCYLFATDADTITYECPCCCIIICNTQADCPTGTACTDAGVSTSICYGYDS